MENFVSKELDQELDNDIGNLLTEMTKSNVHPRKPDVNEICAQYFDQNVEKFEHAEETIKLLLQSITSKKPDKNANKIKKAEVIAQQRDRFLAEIRQCFDCIKHGNFESKVYDNLISDNAQSQWKPKSRDNFCDYILQGKC